MFKNSSYSLGSEVVKEIWAQTLVQDNDRIDREFEDVLADMHKPKIMCELVERSSKKPKSK